MDLVMDVYSVSNGLPAQERFGLVVQARRSAVSVPSNIAEGVGRLTRGEKRQFFGQARGSLNELRTQMEIAFRLGLVERAVWESLEERADKVGRGLAGLINWTRT
jgi:four helix bundle protein